ncbi:type I-E CRISPR-associated protein Cse1/CasA [Nitrosomonas sp.]|uniref:type I-E CRISPR-associated protein Cse1/CasA n=1 Tax=Nitrosomonas sp. TaxID=42353 RepID=UPI0025DB887B|nr:type I-E CRISPR-associated protein Cse1/CasA [Nitrosomonas sp.]
MESSFNLIDEPWIPVADYERVSLRDIFSRSEYQSLGGNPVQKIAVFKLLLAIAQAAATPADEKEWREQGAQGMAEKCLAYLDKWHDRFFLYGEKPFLQMPAIAAASSLSDLIFV